MLAILFAFAVWFLDNNIAAEHELKEIKARIAIANDTGQLYLYNISRAGNQAIEQISLAQNLSELKLEDFRTGSRGLSGIQNSRSLRIIAICNADLNPRDIECLTRVASLRSIVFVRCRFHRISVITTPLKCKWEAVAICNCSFACSKLAKRAFIKHLLSSDDLKKALICGESEWSEADFREIMMQNDHATLKLISSGQIECDEAWSFAKGVGV